MGYEGNPPHWLLAQLDKTVDDLVRQTPAGRAHVNSLFSGNSQSGSVPRTRSIEGTQGPYSHVSKKDTCDPSDVALSRARPPISIGMGPADHLNWLTKNGWKWGGCGYKTSRIPTRPDEAIYVSWAYKKTGGKLSLRPKKTAVTTRAEVHEGIRFETAWWAACNAVKYREIDDKTDLMTEGFDTFVANGGRPSGKPEIRQLEDDTAYVYLPMSEHTYDTYTDWKNDPSTSGQGSSAGESGRGGLSGRSERH